MILKRDPVKKQQRKQKRAEHIVRVVETAKSYQKPTKTRIKISHNRHTGKKLPMHCTSYAILFFILIFTGLFTFFITQQTVTAGPTITDSGSVAVSGIVPGAPPSQAAVITSPANGTRFSSNIITVSGTCEAGFLVEIYRDNSFAGSQVCDTNGQFTLKITIVIGSNEIIAKISDALAQYGPDSESVLVFLEESATGVSESNVPGSPRTPPLLIYTKPVQRGVFPKQLFTIKYEIAGGQAPYALSVNWGDGSDADIKPLKKPSKYDQNHIFEKPGQYSISLTATDVSKSKAYAQTISVVNGPVEPLTGNVFTFASALCAEQQGLSGLTFMNNSSGITGFAVILPSNFAAGNSLVCRIIQNANIVRPLIVLASTMTFSFWIGERIILRRYKKLIKT